MKDVSTVLVQGLLGVALALNAGASASAALRVGASRIDITPPTNAANPTGKYEHERLYVRAIVLDNGTARAVLIGADQSGMPEEAWKAASQQIAADVDCPVSNI